MAGPDDERERAEWQERVRAERETREGREALVPEGFPAALDDAELEAAAVRASDGMRSTIVDSGLGGTLGDIVLGYGTLIDVARAELFRRHLRRSERLARLALLVAIGSAIVTTTLAVFAVTADETPDRIVEVRERLPADAGAAEQALLESMLVRLDKQAGAQANTARAQADTARALRAIRRDLARQPQTP